MLTDAVLNFGIFEGGAVARERAVFGKAARGGVRG